MERISQKEELWKVLADCNGCVIYGAGLVATCLVQYLIREKKASKVVCAAVERKERNPVSILGIPVCELRQLEAYRETYVFLIATLEHAQPSIRAVLAEFGCRMVTGLSDLCYTAIREEVNDLSPDIMCALHRGLHNIYDNFTLLDRKLDDRMDRLQEELTGLIENRLAYLIEEQNEVSAVNTNAFQKYRNCYQGRDLVIVATGPSLNLYQPIEGAIHIGVNTAYKNPEIPLEYLFVQDGRPAFLKEKYQGLEKVRCKVFMGRTLKRSPYEYTEFPETYRLQENVTDYVIDHVWPNERLYQDICHHPLSGGITVTFSALHFALYTCPRNIYLVGCDCTPAMHYDGTVDPESAIDDRAVSVMLERYQMTKEFARIHYPDTAIISVNPVGLKGVFQDMYQKNTGI